MTHEPDATEPFSSALQTISVLPDDYSAIAEVAACPENPVHNIIFEPKYGRLFETKPRSIATFGIRYQDAVTDLKLHPENMAKFQFPETPPWTLTPLNINLEIAHTKKSETNTAFYQAAHKEIGEHFPGYNLIYRDGSLSGSKAASAAVLGDESFSLRLPDKSSIFTAEMYALLITFQQIEKSSKKHFIIFLDSKSALQVLQSKDWANPLILQLLEQHHLLSTVLAKTIHFYWIPSHVGIKGNDLADQAAKDATSDDHSSLPVPYIDQRRHINSFVQSKWQSLWNVALNNKLHAIQPDLGHWPGSRHNARREEVVLARISGTHVSYT